MNNKVVCGYVEQGIWGDLSNIGIVPALLLLCLDVKAYTSDYGLTPLSAIFSLYHGGGTRMQ